MILKFQFLACLLSVCMWHALWSIPLCRISPPDLSVMSFQGVWCIRLCTTHPLSYAPLHYKALSTGTTGLPSVLTQSLATSLCFVSLPPHRWQAKGKKTKSSSSNCPDLRQDIERRKKGRSSRETEGKRGRGRGSGESSDSSRERSTEKTSKRHHKHK